MRASCGRFLVIARLKRDFPHNALIDVQKIRLVVVRVIVLAQHFDPLVLSRQGDEARLRLGLLTVGKNISLEDLIMKVRDICLGFVSFWAGSACANAVVVDLGTASSFAVLGGSTVTNTGSTVIDGNLGVSPGTAITGFPPGIVNGTIDDADAVAMQAQTDLNAAYNFAGAEACGDNLTGQNLGGLTLTPGVYCFSSSAQLTGTLTLDAEGDPNSVFLFQIGSTLTTASGSAVDFINGGQGGGVFWQVGSSATLGTTTAFEGSILALTSITMNTGATIDCGRALANNGAVTMDTNVVSIASVGGCQATASAAPEPGSAGLLATGVLLGAIGYLLRVTKVRVEEVIKCRRWSSTRS